MKIKETDMKKLLTVAVGLILSMGIFFSGNMQIYAEETYDGPDFYDDFESYKLDTDENYNSRQLWANWTNGWLDEAAGVNDAECKDDKFSIVADPKNAENKVLLMDTASKNSSFFYLTIKDGEGNPIEVKNFTLTFKFLAQPGGDAYWYGIASRKSEDTRYNGCNNIMTNVRIWSETAFSPDGYRQVSGSGLLLSLKNEDRSAAAGGISVADTFADWHTYKLIADGNKFDMYIDDVHLGGTDITQTSGNKHGYLSLISAVAKVYIDDFRMVNNDTEAPEVQEPEPEPETPVSEVPELTGESIFKVSEGSENALEVGIDVKEEEISGVNMNSRVIMSKYYSYSDGKLVISGDFIKELAAGEYSFSVETDGGSAAFTLTVEKKSGCGADIWSSSIILIAVAGLIALYAIQKIASCKIFKGTIQTKK